MVHVTYSSLTHYSLHGHICCRDADAIDSLDRYAMACPALPLCGLAIGEAERGLPDINNRIRALMNKLGFGADEHFHIRMTGCPNGCTRPYMAELGFVGDGPNSYQLWLGGTASQTRLAEPFMERMKVQVRLTTACLHHQSSLQPFNSVLFSTVHQQHCQPYLWADLVSCGLVLCMVCFVQAGCHHARRNLCDSGQMFSILLQRFVFPLCSWLSAALYTIHYTVLTVSIAFSHSGKGCTHRRGACDV